MVSANVRLTLIWTLLNSSSQGIWSFQMLSIYLQQITGSKFKVGLAEGIQGAIKIPASLIAGYWVDVPGHRRDHSLVLAEAISLFAISTVCAAMVVHNHEYVILTAGVSLWGVYNGITCTAVESMFADSVSTCQRSKVYTQRYMVGTLSRGCGHLSASLFSGKWGMSGL